MDFWIWYWNFTHNEEIMREAVKPGAITEEQFKEITGIKY